MMTDRTSQLTKFLCEDVKGLSQGEILAAIGARWPDLTRDEFDAAFKSAIEIKKADGEYHLRMADELDRLADEEE